MVKKISNNNYHLEHYFIYSIFILYTAQRLLVQSDGPAKVFQAESLGIYNLDGGFSNGKPTYKHALHDRYIHWSLGSHWMVSKITQKLKSSASILI